MNIFIFCLFFISLTNAETDIKLSIEEIIDEILQNIIGNLTEEYPVNNKISSGQQEWGTFSIDILNGTLLGLDGMTVENIDYQGILHLKNLTVSFVNITVFGDYYNLDGYINFPISNKPVDLFGTGSINLSLLNIGFFASADFAFLNKKLQITELNGDVFVGNITMQLGNLMGGGDLGWAFNTVLNDVGVPSFNFFKDDILDKVLPKIKDTVNAILANL